MALDRIDELLSQPSLVRTSGGREAGFAADPACKGPSFERDAGRAIVGQKLDQLRCTAAAEASIDGFQQDAADAHFSMSECYPCG